MYIYAIYVEVELVEGFPERLGPYILLHTKGFPQDTVQQWVDNALETGVRSAHGVVGYLVENHNFISQDRAATIVITQKDLHR